MAGIYNPWVDLSTGEMINSFAILTTAANPLMEKIHNIKKRMPVIVSPDCYAKWLSPNLSRNEVMDFFVPFPSEKMIAEEIEKVF